MKKNRFRQQAKLAIGLCVIALSLVLVGVTHGQAQEGLIVGMTKQYGVQDQNYTGSILPLSADGVPNGDRLELGNRTPFDLLYQQGVLFFTVSNGYNNVRLARVARNDQGQQSLTTMPFPGPYDSAWTVQSENGLILGAGPALVRGIASERGIELPPDMELALPVKGVASLMVADPSRSKVYLTIDELSGRGLWEISAGTFRQILPGSRDLSRVYRMTLDQAGNLYLLQEPYTGFGGPTVANYLIWRLPVDGSPRQVIQTAVTTSGGWGGTPFAISADGRYAFIADRPDYYSGYRIVRFDLSSWSGSPLYGEIIHTFPWGYPDPLVSVSSLTWGQW